MPTALGPVTSALLEGLLWYAVFGLLAGAVALAVHRAGRGSDPRGRSGRRERRPAAPPRHRSPERV